MGAGFQFDKMEGSGVGCMTMCNVLDRVRVLSTTELCTQNG